MDGSALGICVGCGYSIFFLAYLAACIASPALATKAMVEQGLPMSSTSELWKWHAGLGYALVLMSMLRGGRNRCTANIDHAKASDPESGAGQVGLKPSFVCCWELVVGLLGLAMTIGLAVTSFKIYFETNNHGHNSVSTHMFYSAICGIVVSMLALVIIPITICCAFCAFCTGIMAMCFGRQI